MAEVVHDPLNVRDPPKPSRKSRAAYIDKRTFNGVFCRNRCDKNRQSQITRENAILQKKLKALKREGPSTFHAPQGTKSLKSDGDTRRSQTATTSSTMPGKPTCPDGFKWPPGVERKTTPFKPKPHCDMDPSKTECQDRGKKDQVVEAETKQGPVLGKPGVPKTLSIAMCGGCGRTGRHGAKSQPLRPCQRCGEAWYCCEACAAIDWHSHRLVCNHTTSGKWMPSGMRASEDHWVANASMAQGLRLLTKCRVKKGNPGNSVANIEKSITKVRQQELALEKQQRLIEDRAYFGLDGPRPCLYMGGKPLDKK